MFMLTSLTKHWLSSRVVGILLLLGINSGPFFAQGVSFAGLNNYPNSLGSLNNPAQMGTEMVGMFAVSSRSQWLTNSTPFSRFAAEGVIPGINPKHTFGAQFVNRKVGPIITNGFTLNYVHKIKTESMSLSFGLKGGGVQERSGYNRWEFTRGDPLIQTYSIMRPTFGFGTYFQYKRWVAGASLPELLDVFPSQENTHRPRQMYFNLNAGYLYPFTEDLEIKLNGLYKYHSAAYHQVDVLVALAHKQVGEIGVLLRTGTIPKGSNYKGYGLQSLAFSAQLPVSQETIFGFSYEYSLKAIHSSTIELYAKYMFNNYGGNWENPHVL